MGMQQKLTQCEHSRICLVAADRQEYMFLRRWAAKGYLCNPFSNYYAREAYWQSIPAAERTRIVARTMGQRHPNRVFGGLTAACLWRLEHSTYLDRGGAIIVSSASNRRTPSHNGKLCATYLPDWERESVQSRDGVNVTGIKRTLLDCGRAYEFRHAMAFFDSAIAQGLVVRDELLEYLETPRLGVCQDKALLVAQHATGLNENGGESFCYATMLEEGFSDVRQQVEFVNPQDANDRRRADFVAVREDGRLVVIEFDGMRKYDDPTMTGGRTTGEVVADERRREATLQTCGVAEIVRCTFEEVRRRVPLVNKLVAAGLPRGARLNTA
ncbi:hypothetical protein [Bifidobacterium oedipodis]|nr:hypothetical protein [Bifidobacterium sp. DSM 109957]